MSDALDYLTGIGGLIANPISTLINNHHNEQLIKEQNQWNLEQWQRENFYNSPQQQMLRLKAAGLNPNLMYGNGAGSLLSAPSPTIQASRTEAPQVDPLAMAQINNLKADTAEKESRVPYNIILANKVTEETNQVRATIDQLVASKGVLNKQANLLDIQGQREAYALATDVATWQTKVETAFYLSGQAQEDYIQKVLYNANYPRFIDASIEHINAIINNLNVDAQSKRALMAKIQPEIDNLIASKGLIDSQHRSQSQNNAVFKTRFILESAQSLANIFKSFADIVSDFIPR